MNERLKFSWGHILAFLALIFIAYVTFMGITYFTLGNFIVAGIGALVCVIFLALFLLGAQIKKGTSTKFYKSIIWERFFILLSPIVLLLTFYPYNHFWSVLEKEAEIVKDFNTTISNVHGIFDEYEAYASQRLEKLSTNTSNFSKEEQENRIDELKLLLLSKNYDKFKSEANSWIDKASKNSTVWNVFLLGNVDNVALAIEKWTNNLNFVSAKYLACENYNVQNFDKECTAKQAAIKGLADLKDKYSNTIWQFNILALVTMSICFLMLLCPYFIQERNAANCEHFWDFGILSNFYDKNDDTQTNDRKKYTSMRKGKTVAQGYPSENNNNKDYNKINNKPKTSKGAPV